MPSALTPASDEDGAVEGGSHRGSGQASGRGGHGDDPARHARQSGERRKKRRPESAGADQVYRVVQPKPGKPSRLKSTRANPAGARHRAPDPRHERAKHVVQQLADLGVQEVEKQARAGVIGRAGWRKVRAQVDAGVSLEFCSALRDLVIVSADGGRR